MVTREGPLSLNSRGPVPRQVFLSDRRRPGHPLRQQFLYRTKLAFRKPGHAPVCRCQPRARHGVKMIAYRPYLTRLSPAGILLQFDGPFVANLRSRRNRDHQDGTRQTVVPGDEITGRRFENSGGSAASGKRQEKTSRIEGVNLSTVRMSGARASPGVADMSEPRPGRRNISRLALAVIRSPNLAS